jgi:RHS repeat-associated protein
VACFTDQENDPESGLMYYGARYYDPWVGRFLSQDPGLISANPGGSFNRIVDDPGHANAYTYALNRPTVMVDPNGEIAVYVSITFSGGAGGGGQVSVGRAVDGKGNYGKIDTAGAGGYGGIGGSLTINFGVVPGANTINDLGGQGSTSGGSVSQPGAGLTAGAETVTGNNADGSTYVGGEGSVGIGAGAAPAEGHGFATTTVVTPIGSLFGGNDGQEGAGEQATGASTPAGSVGTNAQGAPSGGNSTSGASDASQPTTSTGGDSAGAPQCTECSRINR